MSGGEDPSGHPRPAVESHPEVRRCPSRGAAPAWGGGLFVRTTEAIR
jgi:hypothetical protein